MFHSRIQVDTGNILDLASALRNIGSVLAVNGVLCGYDAILGEVAKACELANIQFTSIDGVRNARNKFRTRRLTANAGLNTPAFRLVSHLDNARQAMKSIGYPCVLKPTRGHLSQLCVRIDDEAAIDSNLSHLSDAIAALHSLDQWILQDGFICEEWVDGPIISAQIAAVSEIYELIALSLGTTQAENPCVGYGSLIPFEPDARIADACSEFAINVCKKLGLDIGVFDIEIIWSDCGPVLIEANARRMGGEMPLAYNLATGFSFESILLDVYTGQVPRITRDFRRSTLIRKIIACTDSRVAEQFDVDDFCRSLNSPTRLIPYNLDASQSIQKLDVLGRLLLISDQYSISFSEADAILDELEYATGVPLVRGHLPELANQVKN